MTTLDQLEQRVAALEADQAVDQLNPNVLTVNADGTIGANFTGHVHAQGLDLDAGTNATPPTVDQVRWLRASDGAAVATIAAYTLNSGDGILVLVAQAAPPSPNAVVFVNTGALTRQLLAQDGSSDWLFKPNPPPAVAGSRAGNAALASLLTALAGLHLVNDTTTP